MSIRAAFRGLLPVLLALSASTALANDLDVRRPTTVLAGKHEILRLDKVRAAKVANSAIAEVKVLSPGELLVKGVAKGETTVTISRLGEPDVIYQLAVVDRVMPAENELITLGVGLQKTLPAEGAKRIAVGDPKIANVQVVSGKEILITGTGAGRTSLIVWLSDDVRTSYTVKVEEKAIEEVLKEIKQLLGPMEGVTLKVVGEKIYLEGEPLTVEDSNLALKVCKLYDRALVCL